MSATEPSLQIHANGRPRRTVEWTVAEYAQYERVDESTVRRWILKGAVHVRRTPGGGIRVVTKHDE